MDIYFSFSANLGTHTFFMLFLPILFWCGASNLGRSFVHILASGVFFSGFLKDLFCLPRPLSPPLHRITMSGSAALEYGFPSTHSTNAVSVALFSLWVLPPADEIGAPYRQAIGVLAVVYAVSILLGRLYCGMHGFLDVICGSILGALLSYAEFMSIEAFNELIISKNHWFPISIIAVALFLVTIHPEPADPCPCFDDGVAFIGVVIGVDAGQWHYVLIGKNSQPVIPFSWTYLGPMKTILRIALGIAAILVWREIMKPLLHRLLPPVYRFIESQIGWTLPRRYFMQASQYKQVPSHLPDDTLVPIADIPDLIRKVRRPRSDSVGPQSAADVYESIAVRERSSRQSIKAPNRVLSSKESSSSASDSVVCENISRDARSNTQDDTFDTQVYSENDKIFDTVERPRARYDVEVVTKLVVYAGIGWVAVEGAPILFDIVGLGIAP